MTKYFVDAGGNYLGGFDGAEPPPGSLEVPTAPDDGRQVWSSGNWGSIPITVPTSVSPAQAEIALYRYDDGILLGNVNALIAAYPYEPVRIWWRKATYIARDHPYLQAIAIELGLSEETVDTLFITAEAI